jgi:hypothetical protein
MEPAADGEAGLRERARLHVQLRPLIGWTAAEGGFQGLYYNEMRGRLSTTTKICEDSPGFHLGDICQDETTTIRVLLIKTVLEQGQVRYTQYQQEFEVFLTEEAETLLVKKRIPLPHWIEVKE